VLPSERGADAVGKDADRAADGVVGSAGHPREVAAHAPGLAHREVATAALLGQPAQVAIPGGLVGGGDDDDPKLAAGLVCLGVVALDGTKVAANAASRANRTLVKLKEEVAQILREAADADQAEDHQHGPAYGDDLPAELTSPTGRLARLQQAKAQLEAEAAERQRRYQKRVAELAAAAHARGRKPRAHIKPRRRDEAPNPGRSLTSPISTAAFSPPVGHGAGLQRPGGGDRAPDRGGCRAHPASQRPATARPYAGRGRPDPGRGRHPPATREVAGRLRLLVDRQPDLHPNAPELLIPPAKHGRQGKPRKDGKPSESKSDGLRAAMAAKLASEQGKACYAMRKQTVEPVFGQPKEWQGARRFTRRGLAACDAEWKLLCGTHNLLKLWRHTRRRPAPTPTAA
jgi:Transposase DDE domain